MSDAPFRLLVAAQMWPSLEHGSHSAPAVVYELVRAFTQQRGYQVSFVCTPISASLRDDPGQEDRGRALLDRLGVSVLPPIPIPPWHGTMPRVRSVTWPRVEDYFPESRLRRAAQALVEEHGIDVVFVPWSEKTTQIFACCSTIKVAYYGNPDPKNRRIRTSPPFAVPRSYLPGLVDRLRLWHYERIHLREMSRYELLGNVAANDAQYYRERGIRRAFYVRMVYPQRDAVDWRTERPRLEDDSHPVIVANVGRQDSTGNVLGLAYLADHVLGPLARALHGLHYEVRLLGGGRLPEWLQRKLDRPEVSNLGYVEDIDRALLRAQVFLCLNNATDYKVNQSRYLHAWSLGSCIVAHADAVLSLPEMAQGYNALLGRDGSEIVAHVKRAIESRVLRDRIGANGYATFSHDFDAASVVADLARRIHTLRQARSRA